MARNHAVSFSFFFDDPEGRLIQVFWPTGVAFRPRHGDAIDLALPEQAPRREVANQAARTSGREHNRGSL
jgi:hypothetical protein